MSLQNQKTVVTQEDYQVIVRQLDREPRGVLQIATRCPHGFPQVIVNRPIHLEGENVQIFPTLFWLTCPYLGKVVGQLESQGMIGELQEKIAGDPEFAADVAKAHEKYAEARRELIPEDVLRALAKNYPGRAKVLMESGVGGNRNYQGVKCLHTHLADFLARGENPIGKIVWEKINGVTACSSGDCALEK